MEAIERFAISQDWITAILLLELCILVSIKYAFPQRFAHFIMLFATDKYLLLKGKNPKIFHPFNVMFFILNVLTTSLVVFIFYREITPEYPDRPKILYIRIATAYAAFVLLKFSVEKILSNLLSIEKEMDFYLFYKLSYRNFMALALLPISMVWIYTWEPNLTALYTLISIVLLINLITILGLYRKNQRFILDHWFYFILYLCALEIGPYFILYKLITML